MKKRYNILIPVVIFAVLAPACDKSFLEVAPKGVLTEDNLSGPEFIDGFVISAYSHIAQKSYRQTFDGWFYGDARGDNTHKGGSGLTDQSAFYEMEIFAPVTANVGNNTQLWESSYQTISRINSAIRQINSVTEDEYPLKDARLAEMKFLRAFSHLVMKERYKWIPYITEDMTSVDIKMVPNRSPDADDDLDLWQLIYDDFEFASEKLPDVQDDPGRPTKFAAEAYMVKTLMWMAYKQDEEHQLISINAGILEDALELCDNIISKSNRALTVDYAENFLFDYENNEESLFELQFSINDGTTKGRLNYGVTLNTPRWQPSYRCCDFNKVSYNLVNAFRTGADGLPLFETFNDAELHNNYTAYFDGNTFDPRLSHTVAIPGHPWKYDPLLKYDSLGSRNPDVYGYIHSLKEQVHPDCSCQWENRQNSMNKRLLRFSQILMWKAEILIRLNREIEALPLINDIRGRAINSQGRLLMEDGSPILDYNIELYQPGVNCTWSNEYAWEAYKFEDRLEFASEGTRFFNLVRWNDAAEVLNKYFTEETPRKDWFSNAFFTAGKNEYMPIPQSQINLSEGVYVQNHNY
ncbi:MAG: RagB/SusD family nutrient uptake outer membrane protein [Bacteroidales bacterium]|nr:RagB/SusD family nutrient uptake outer membrane protein [Bacteroidales bacterium]